MRTITNFLSFCAAGAALLPLLAQAQQGIDPLADQRDTTTSKITISTTNYPTGAGTVTGGGSKTAGSSFTLTESPKTAVGAVFLNWTISNTVVGTKSTYTFTPTNNETVVANFGYAVTTTSSASTAEGTTSGSGIYTNGQTVTVVAMPKSCYNFVNWTAGARSVSSNASYTFTIGAGESLVAHFQQQEDIITTASSPTGGGTTTGKGTYGCGNRVTVSAKAAAGYKFNGWLSGQQLVNQANPYSFNAEGSETLTAVFLDISVPTVAFTSPAASEKVGVSTLHVTGTAKNILGVSGVVLTVGDNMVTVNSTNYWTNWWADVVLSPGANVLSAYALSEVQTASATKTITITDTNTGYAPFSLSGLLVNVSQGTNTPFWVSFGPATMEQFSADTNNGSSVANYTYTQTGPDTATLSMHNIVPPNQNGGGGTNISLTFTGPTNFSFSDPSGNSGTGSFIAGSPALIDPPSGRTVVAVNGDHTSTNITTYGDGTFSTVATEGNYTGTYRFAQFGPQATLNMQAFQDPNNPGYYITNYSLNFHTNTGEGYFYATAISSFDGSVNYYYGTFSSTYQGTGVKYVAPETLNGYSVTVQQLTSPTVSAASAKPAFNVTFGLGTMAQTSTDTNNGSGVSDYVYTRTGADTAVLDIYHYLPPGSDNHTQVALLFTTPTKATFADQSGSAGTVTLAALTATNAPLALPAAKITAYPTGGNTTTVIFSDGNYTNVTKADSGTYTYSQFSPAVGFLVLSSSSSANLDYLQLNFPPASAASGDTFYHTKSDGSVAQGAFTIVP